MKKFFHLIIFVIQFVFYWTIYPLAKLIYGNKRVYIICERGCDARDNGYFMFKYLATEHPYINQYYLIDKKSSDYEKVKSIGKVCSYKSLKHWFLYCAAEVRMSTHMLFAPGNFIGEWFKRHKQSGINVFLQHGITHNEFPSSYYKYNGSDLFICGAKDEFDFITNNCGYPSGNVVYTGFARFDSLHNFETKKQILIMPTWRQFLYNNTCEEFETSSYFQHWSSVLKNEKLHNFCFQNNISIVFYPHFSLQHFVSCFKKLENDVVRVADFDHFDVQELLKESAVLVTDYSSIFFDFAYMRKPEILYQFDEDEFYGKHYKRSYFNHKKDGFGMVCCKENELILELINICERNFTLETLYKNRIDSFFSIYDDNNCERIYQAIVKKFIEKKKKHLYFDDLNVIATADDYGRNFESSEGIRQALKKNYVQQVSVMVNKDEKDCLDVESIRNSVCSLHLNLSEGYATYGDTSNYCYSVNNKGSITHDELITRRGYFKLSDKAKETVSLETKAQIDKYKRLGFTNLSFDSHGHIHTNLPIAKIVIPIFKEEKFVFYRRTSNINTHSKLLNRFYKFLVNKKYKKYFESYSYFGSCDDFIHIKHYKRFKNKKIEIMTHPFINKYGQLVNRRDIDFSLLYRGD